VVDRGVRLSRTARERIIPNDVNPSYSSSFTER
jgi:hypothetical protein